MTPLDKALEEMRRDEPSAATVAEAGERVRQNLFGENAATAGRSLKCCRDFQGLLVAYLGENLPEARRLLLEDHLRGCVACRRALERLRSGPGVRPVLQAGDVPRQPAPFRWTVAAGVVLAAGLSAFAVSRWLPGAFHPGPQAEVAAVDGVLFRTTGGGGTAARVGEAIGAAEPVRTPAGARASLRLWDGSRIEMNERSQISLRTSWKGTTIRLDRGHIIVHAARQRQGELVVAAADARVAAKGTVFSVNQGTLGSRVAVAEGGVEVSHSGKTESLKAGEQITTSPMVGQAPLEAEFAWSRDAARYLALLGELEMLQKRWESLPSQGLRYRSRLLGLVPEDTRLLAALPNAGPTLAEARRIFEEQLAGSPELRAWWTDPARAKLRREIDQVLDLVKDMSAVVGEEILIAVRAAAAGKERVALIAEIRDPMAETKIASVLRRAAGANGSLAVRYAIRDHILLLAESTAGLVELEAAQARGGAPETAFRRRIAGAYPRGAGWLFAADLASLPKGDFASAGFDALESVVVERREVGGRVDNSASIHFTGQRKGIPAWLGSPSAMSSLNFVSPEASLALAVIVKEPSAIVEELYALARRGSPDFDAQLAERERELGIRVRDDFAAALGTEVTVALDGPVLPVPSWKLAAEVHAPQRLLATIEKLVEAYNRHAATQQTPLLTLRKETVKEAVFVQITGGRLPTDIHFTFADSYLVAAPDRVLLTQALQNRTTGLSLLQSARFREQLPYAGEPNCSGLLYYDLSGAVSSLAETFGGLIPLSETQKASVSALQQAKPGLFLLYGGPDSIRVATTGVFGGFHLGMLANPSALFSVLSRQTP